MKKNLKKRAIRFVVTLVMVVLFATGTICLGKIALKSLVVGMKMQSLSEEALYYQSYRNWEERDAGVRKVEAKRAELLNSSDAFTAKFASIHPLAKIAIFCVSSLGTVVMVIGCWLAFMYLWYRRKLYARDIRRIARM